MYDVTVSDIPFQVKFFTNPNGIVSVTRIYVADVDISQVVEDFWWKEIAKQIESEIYPAGGGGYNARRSAA